MFIIINRIIKNYPSIFLSIKSLRLIIFRTIDRGYYGDKIITTITRSLFRLRVIFLIIGKTITIINRFIIIISDFIKIAFKLLIYNKPNTSRT